MEAISQYRNLIDLSASLYLCLRELNYVQVFIVINPDTHTHTQTHV